MAFARRLESVYARLPDRLRRWLHHVRVRPGHYYSPYPDLADLRARHDRVFATPEAIPAVELREAAQLELLSELEVLARDLPWADHSVPGLRYRYDNRPFGVGDAVFLATMLRRSRPSRYVEIGSGWSTALVLDVRDRFLDGELDIVAVDPYPQRLLDVLGDERPARFELRRHPAQELDPALVAELSADDVLFIDSTHVARAGGDVNHLVFEVLPLVPSGVLVHFHDVFANFEYPPEWVYQGRAWSEAYLLRAFLMFNERFDVVLLTDWMQRRHAHWFSEHLPQCAPNPGAALWIRRR